MARTIQTYDATRVAQPRRWIRCRAAIRSGLDGLRAYSGTAVLTALTLGIALAVVLPATFFSTIHDGGIHSRLALWPMPGGDLGLSWPAAVRPPSVTRQDAVDSLGILLIGMTGAVALVGAITILILAGARESTRMTEIAVRRSVGASRRTLLGGLALEAGLLIAGALLIGGAVAWLLGWRAVARWPGVLRPGTLSLGMLVVAGLAAVVTFGILLPVLWPRRRLADGETPAPIPLAPTALQLGVSLVVLTASSLVVQYAAGFTKPIATRSGDGVVFPVSLTHATPHERTARYQALLQTIAEWTSVEVVSLTSPGTLVGLGSRSMATTDCGACYEGGIYLPWHTKEVTYHLLSADSFRVLGMPVVEGRPITSNDTWDAPRVAVISRSLALREFQGGQAIGRHIRVPDDGKTWSTVVGVVDDPSPKGFGGSLQSRYAVYLSVLQHPPTFAELVVRGSPFAGLAQAVQAKLREVSDPPAAPAAWRRESAVLAAEGVPAAWFGRWFGVQGWAMLGIAVIGTFALMQLWVRSLWGEIGVRRAAGARRAQVLRFVLARAARVGVAGTLIGLWFGSAVWTIAPAVLPGLPAWDGRIVVRFAALLVGSTLVGALLPAWRAIRTSPVELIAHHV